MVASAPLIVDPGGHHRFTAARLVVISVILTVGLIASRRGFVTDRRVARAWVAVLLVTTAATIFGVDPLQSLVGDPVRLMGLLGIALGYGAFLVATSAGPAALGPVTTALLGGGAVVTLIGLSQLGSRPTSTLGNAGFLGAYLCLLLPVLVARSVSVPLLRFYGVAVVVVLAATTTRGAWLGATAGLAVMAMLWWKRAWPILALAAAAVAVVVLPVVARDTGQGRVDTWAESASVIEARPLLGWGPEGFRTGFIENVSAGWVHRYKLDQIPDRAHNRFLDIAATTGTAGVVADVMLLGLVSLAIRRTLRVHDRGSSEWWAVAGVTGGLVAYLVQSMFLFDTFDLAVVAWVLAGVVVAAGPAGETRNVPSRSVVKFIAGSVALSLFAISNFVADRIVQSTSGEPARQAIAGLRRAAAIRPRALDTYLLAGLVALHSDDVVAVLDAHTLLRGWNDPYVQQRDHEVLRHLAELQRRLVQ